MTKPSFKASRIVIKDIPKDHKVSADEMKKISGGMSYVAGRISKEFLILRQRSSSSGAMLLSSLASNMSSCATHTT